jgi:hypothetical protein
MVERLELIEMFVDLRGTTANLDPKELRERRLPPVR